jgi:GR25 family glycosyltransferase involved in LPS biosynthesis
VKSVPFLPGIEDAFVINLDRRQDRLEKFFKTHPQLEGRVNRCAAVDGKTLKLTPELAKLFGPNDFFWKKAVMGCALSHLSLWTKLAYEHPDIHNYLIFEDDAKMQPGWEEVVAKSMAHVPGDYDVLYLGGILPPNRAGFEKLLEPVTKYYSRIKPHQFFGQQVPNRYFHSCAYAYIISREGIMKIMGALEQRSGYWTSADHIMCSPCDTMNLYFLNPSVAGCFQDDDPNYANSDFNNFSRVDSFDSDLWNNDERFSPEEIEKNRALLESEPFNLKMLLKAVYSPVKTEEVAEPLEPVKPLEGLQIPPAQTVITDTMVAPRFVTVKEFPLDFRHVYERDWLFALLGGISTANVETVDTTTPLPKDCPIVIMQRPHIISSTKLMKFWNDNGVRFKILHLSDEGDDNAMRDPLIAYTFPCCVSVLRFYVRDDFPPGTESKINVIPLGYRWSPLNLRSSPLERTPNLPFREFHWSFYGTDWNKRSQEMAALVDAKLIKSYRFYKGWNDPESLSREDYLGMLVNSIFVPCPPGMNPETFRFYEALEAGCIPVVLKTRQNEAWFRWVSERIPLVDMTTWEDAVRVMMQLLSNPERLEIYRNQVMNGWVSWTKELKEQAQRWFLST